MTTQLRKHLPVILKAIDYVGLGIDLYHAKTLTKFFSQQVTDAVFEASTGLKVVRFFYPPIETHIFNLISQTIKLTIKRKKKPLSFSTAFRSISARFLGDSSPVIDNPFVSRNFLI